MEYYYSAERNVQMVLYLLKAFNIKKVIASPGATNIAIVASMQQDPYFEMYSCVDERSAAYMAVGMAEECNEPVVLSCTGATSARNYMPGLTEAYYRKLPIIAITSTKDETQIGHLIAQVTDRTTKPKDIIIDSVHIQNIRSKEDEWDCNIKLNRIFQSFQNNMGPIHINLSTGMGGGHNIKQLPPTKIIKRYFDNDNILPELPDNKRIAIFIGSHKKFTDKEISAIDNFCLDNNSIVLCDHTSSYNGKYKILHALIGAQENNSYELNKIDLLIHIGEISGNYDTLQTLIIDKVWRVSPDGKFRDTFFGHLDAVFAMNEESFFKHYTRNNKQNSEKFYNTVKELYDSLIENFPEPPLSNIYIAKTLSKNLPKDSVVYLGILNTLRSWNYFEVDKSIKTVCNVGGFGIDGIISSLIGSSICSPKKLHFGIVGDLSFFYDMNSIGNRHITNNLRILVINNGHGQEFEMYNHMGAFLGNDVNDFVAAAGHFGNKSKKLLMHYAQDLGFEYLYASNKEEFELLYKNFVTPNNKEKPILFEIFTTNKDENEALRISRNIDVNNQELTKKIIKSSLKKTFSLTNKLFK